MPARVLHILGSADQESAALVRLPYALARHLDPKKYALETLFLRDLGPWAQKLESAGAAAATVNWTGHLSDMGGAARFWRCVRRRKPDLIHQHVGGRAVGYLARIATDAPILLHVHGTRAESSDQSQRLPGGFATLAVAVSQASAPWVRGAKVEVVYPGVAEPDAQPWPEPFLIGTAARLVPVKGTAILIAAVARLQSDFPRLKLQIAGSGPLENELREQVRRSGAENAVDFLGWRRDLTEVMSRWSVFVLPSLHEGFGVAALEAMNLGIPVVASQVGGIPELVEGGESGLLVPPGNVEALAEALRDILTDDQRRQSMSAASRERARRFPLEREIREFEGLYARLLRV